MKKTILTKILATGLAASILLTSCGTANGTSTGASAENSAGTVGVRLQDDFYSAVNAEWLETTELSPTKPMRGSMADLQEDVTLLMRDELTAMLNGNPDEADPELTEFLTFYSQVLDKDKRNADGVAPFMPYLERITSLQSFEDYKAAASGLYESGIASPFMLTVMSDMAAADQNALYIFAPQLILGSKAYYGGEMGEMLTSTYEGILLNYLQPFGFSAEEATAIAKEAIAFDALLAEYAKTPEEGASFLSMYNPEPLADFAGRANTVDFNALVAEMTPKSVETIVVADPRYYDAFTSVVNEENFNLLKSWMITETLTSVASVLPTEFSEMLFPMSAAMTGATEQDPFEERAFSFAKSNFPEPIGIYYGEKYFGAEAKADVEEMTAKMIAVYKTRIENNTWLTEETKAKAIEKLDNLSVRIGYPEVKSPIYARIEMVTNEEGGSLIENYMNYSLLTYDVMFEKIGQPVAREEWAAPADMVNAFYQPMNNSITFPAAILQAPFYSPDNSDEANLGAIGSVIAHEISHAFDPNGSQFDENGSLSNWWTEEDFAAFEERTNQMTTYFEGAVTEYGPTNGALTVAENVADLGGVACALEVAKSGENPDIKGFFEGWGRVWRQKTTPEIGEMLLQGDNHAPSDLRVNMVVNQFAEFHEAFDVKEEDEMYLAEAERIVIW